MRENSCFSLVDDRFMKRTENLLFSEFSVALYIPLCEVQKYIERKVRGHTEPE